MGDFFIDLDQEHIKEVQKIIFRAVTLHSDVSGESLEIQERLRKLDIPFFLVDSKSGKLILKAKGNQMIEGYEAINQYLDQLDK